MRRRRDAGQPQLHHLESLLAALRQGGERDQAGVRRGGKLERVPESGQGLLCGLLRIGET